MYQVEGVKKKPFEFKIGKETYSVPAMGDLPFPVLLEFGKIQRRGAQGIEITEFMVENIFNRFAPGALDNLTVSQVSDLLAAYNEFSEAGE